MIAEPKTGTRAKPESRVVLRRLLVVVLGLAILEVGAKDRTENYCRVK